MKLIFMVMVFVSIHISNVCADDIFAARTLRAGAVIGPGDIKFVATIDGVDIGDVHGKEMRRTVYEGQKIKVGDFGPPVLVHRNEILTMVYESRGFVIRVDGRALGAAGLGERVEVLNLESRVVVLAVVVGRQFVSVSK